MPVTNETLAALMQTHHDNVMGRIEELTVQVKETNGRLRKAEMAIAILESAGAARMREGGGIGSGQVATGLAIAAAAVWGAVQVLFKMGDLLKGLGLR